MTSFYKLPIKEIIRQTPDAVSIEFDVPDKLKSHFDFVAGQYVSLKTKIGSEQIRRAYSICSSPGSKVLKIAVKAVKDGTFSTYATTELQKGDVLEVCPPEGKFILKPKANKNYIAFAAGSGITPILSMIRDVLETQSTASFTLIYANKTTKDTIFKDELDDLSSKYPQFKLHYIFSRENNQNQLFGRIDKAKVNYFIKNKYKDIHFDSLFLCGPQQMIETISSTFLESGFPENEIYYELFTASDNIDNNSVAKQGQTEITVLLDDEQTTFTMEQSDNILSACLRNKLDPPYSCQGGVCSSCLAKVTQGKAIMNNNSVLTDDELEEGFVLTCVAYPTSSKIVLDYDQV